jgi:hypothetical protein
VLARLLAYFRSNVLAVVALFIALGGTSWALAGSNPFTSATGAISACVTANGSLHLVRGGHRCGRHQRLVTWAQKGATGATGPRGPVRVIKGAACAPTTPGCQGPRGEKGERGEPGPTQGVSSEEGKELDNPPAATTNPTAESQPASITTTAPGRLFVTGVVAGARITCKASGVCHDTWGLYVDGQPVPHSAFSMVGLPKEALQETVSVSGLTAVLPAGKHTFSLRDSGFEADANLETTARNGEPRAWAIALGS